MLWRIYDIEYEISRQDLPVEIIVDLDKFNYEVEPGMGNLNHKVYRAIRDITGCKALNCKVQAHK